MKYATFSLGFDPAPRLGLLRGDCVVDLKTATPRSGRTRRRRCVDLIQAGPDALAADGGDRRRGQRRAQPSRRSTVRWHAPIPRPPKNVFCLGLNYAAHAEGKPPARGREAKIPDGAGHLHQGADDGQRPVRRHRRSIAASTQQVDWEVELGVVIGTTGKNIAQADALQHVFGYTVINDVSARDLQQQHMQWFKGKSLDGFCPMGPVVVTADEFGDPQAKRLQLRVNGVDQAGRRRRPT